MKAKIIYTDNTEADVFMSDGGVTTFHHNGEHMLTTYYQDRIVAEEITGDNSVWDRLAEGKAYIKDWEGEHEVTDEMIEDAIGWLGYNPSEVIIKKFNN